MVHVVVARYNESLDWISRLHPSIDLTVYNKGSSCTLPTRDLTVYNKGSSCTLPTRNKLRVLPNVGRESHTYLRYLVDNYDSLPSLMLFVQGNPFDHCPNFVQCANHAFLTGEKPSHSGVTFGENRIEISNMFPRCHEAIHGDLVQLYSDMFSTPPPHRFHFHAGATLCVTRDQALSRPKHFYEWCLTQQLDSQLDPIYGYCFERLWNFIFDRDYALHKRFSDY
jgi:hypothetical protein